MSIELIIYLVAVVVLIVSLLRNLAYRTLSNKVEQSRTATPTDETLPSISVIITAHNQCDDLRRNLPLVLNQIYPQFEVIVIDINSTDDTKKLLEKMEEDYTDLHHTFTPSTSRDISPQRLAITLGIKAAAHPWVVITQADCCPISHQWLLRMGQAIAGHRSAMMGIGYTRFNKAESYTERKMRFFRFWQQLVSLNFAQKHGAYQCDGTNLIYNKEFFLSHQGFASHSTLLTGATDIMVNQQSTKHNTAICLHPEAVMEQRMPHRKHWKQDRRFFQETRRHFTHTWRYRMRYAASMWLHAMLVVSMTGSIVTSIWLQQYIATAVTLLLWILHMVWQGIAVNTSFRTMENCSINMFRVAWYIHLIPFWDMHAWLGHRFSDKRQYRKKYI